ARRGAGRGAGQERGARLRLRRLRAQAFRPDAQRGDQCPRQRLAGSGRHVTLPDRARVVIIGGGVGGTSIAYHLVNRGWRDVLLVERAQLTSGSTFHSAGLVGQLRSTLPLTRLMMDSVALYGRPKDPPGTHPR